jgi:hypothetical protein
MRPILTAVILSLSLLAARPVLAMCAAEGPLPEAVKAAYDRSSLIFTGEVVMVDTSDPKTAMVLFKVKDNYKGAGKDHAVIAHPGGLYRNMRVSTMVPFVRGENYLVYAEGPLERPSVGGCSRTKSLRTHRTQAFKEIKALKAINSPARR